MIKIEKNGEKKKQNKIKNIKSRQKIDKIRQNKK